MEPQLEDQNPAAEAAEAPPVRRRASRRVSAAAGAAAEVAADVAVTVSDAPAEAAAPAAAVAEAAPEAAPEKAAPKRATRSRKKVEPAEAPAADAEAPAADAAAAAKTAEPATQGDDAPAASTEAAAEPAAEAPKKRATRSRKAAVAEPAPEAVAEQTTEAVAEAASDAKSAGAKGTDAKNADSKSTDSKSTDAKNADAKGTAAKAAEAKAAEAKAADAKTSDSDAAESSDSSDDAETPPARRSRRRANQSTEQADGDAQTAGDDSKPRGRGGNQNGAKNDGAKSDGAKSESAKADNSKAEAAKADAAKSDSDNQGQGDRQGQGDANKQENGSRSSRTRQRDRKRRGGDDLEPEIAEDDVLLPVAGILDVLDNYAFVRTSGYLPGVSDVYVALGQVKKYSLRRGDAIVGAIRQPREGDSGGRQKYNAIVKIDTVNGKPVDETESRADITEMTAIFPEQPLRFGTGVADSLGAQIDEHAPMGLGQRAIIALPAAIPATRVLSELAAAVTANAPAAHLLVVLTNARPEEATYLERTVSGEVIAATFDRAVEDQATVAELAIDRASRLVELGHDVVVLLDSLTDLAHAYLQNQQGARVSPEAVQALAVAQAKRLLGSARNLENGGSLTLLATARTHTGVASDKDLLRELTPAANSFVKISGSRTAPSVNADKSYTITF